MRFLVARKGTFILMGSQLQFMDLMKSVADMSVKKTVGLVKYII